jgi:hypothetical protein
VSLSNIAEYSYRSDNGAKTTATEGYLQASESAATRDIEDEGSITSEAILTAEQPAPAEEEPVLAAAGGVTTDAADSDDEQIPKATVVAEPSPSVSVDVAPAEITVEPASPGMAKGKKAQLNVSVTNQANKNIQELRELLKIVPESAKPTIEKAIEMAERGYEIAINSLLR